jgi:hypothetical protein
MSEKTKDTAVGRREFLRLSGVAAATGGAALAVGGSESQASETLEAASSGYRETDHVKTYYRLARF